MKNKDTSNKRSSKPVQTEIICYSNNNEQPSLGCKFQIFVANDISHAYILRLITILSQSTNTKKSKLIRVKINKKFITIIFYLSRSQKVIKVNSNQLCTKKNDKEMNFTDILRIIDDTRTSMMPTINARTEKPGSNSHVPIISGRTLFFKNIMNSIDKENGIERINLGSWYLMSAFRKNSIRIILCRSKINIGNDFITEKDHLRDILINNKDINIIAITLYEDYFDKVSRLIKYIRKFSNAYIAVGGIMPTISPEHVFIHLPGANIIVRGFGEMIFPTIAKIINGKNINEKLSEEQIEQISGLRGVLLNNSQVVLINDIEHVNYIKALDTSVLDMGLLQIDDVQEGLSMVTSRGCHNSCKFCLTIGRAGHYHSHTIEALVRILHSYQKRLVELFGQYKWIPHDAYKISIYDDDFLGDHDRSIQFFHYILNSPFYINFFQCGINSFFERKNGTLTNVINKRLLDAMVIRVFDKGHRNPNNKYYICIGTENFCDRELLRLGKGYDHRRIISVVDELSRRKIMQAHHMIATNTFTTKDDISENIKMIKQLKRKYAPYFNILTPITPWLHSLYPSNSYQELKKKNMLQTQKIKHVLREKGYPEYDYPLVEHDQPIADLGNAIRELERAAC